MRKLLIAFVILTCGCRGPGEYVVSGSAYVESDRPDGKAVAKVEVQYHPPTDNRDANLLSISPKGASLGAPETHTR
jgi:hypothetical protein